VAGGLKFETGQPKEVMNLHGASNIVQYPPTCHKGCVFILLGVSVVEIWWPYWL